MRRFLLPAAIVLAACSSDKRESETPAPADNVIYVTGTDFAFQMPTTVPAGRTRFEFANNGKVRHELNISRLKPGVSIDTLLATIRANQSVKDLIEGPVGVTFATPGGKSASALTVDLVDGQTYAVICIFTDSVSKKPHHDLGMYGIIKVTPAENSAAPAALAADTIIATDYAFQYPRTIEPGPHTFVMRNEGKQRHEFNIILLKKGVTLAQVLEVDKAGGNIDDMFDGDLGLLHSRGGQTPLGGLAIDMLPGRDYVIACFFQDDEKSPPHYKLGMYGTITTSAKKTT